MYLAKESGRNTVYIAAGTPDHLSTTPTTAAPAVADENMSHNQTTDESP